MGMAAHSQPQRESSSSCFPPSELQRPDHPIFQRHVRWGDVLLPASCQGRHLTTMHILLFGAAIPRIQFHLPPAEFFQRPCVDMDLWRQCILQKATLLLGLNLMENFGYNLHAQPPVAASSSSAFPSDPLWGTSPPLALALRFPHSSLQVVGKAHCAPAPCALFVPKSLIFIQGVS